MKLEAHPNCRFYVEIGEEPWGVFTELSGMQIDITTMDVEEGGRNSYVHRLPGRARIGNVTLKRGMTNTNRLFKWCLDVARGKVRRHNVTVVMYDVKGTELHRWNFINAYPVKWVGPQLNGGQGAVAIETIELAHEGLDHA